ncbi:hypothetical protein C8R46DRAFT_1360977 [Mycena filopes]|nr:hypothetical protein C8R46DRAFT_1360977 [Mycena filopes]
MSASGLLVSFPDLEDIHQASQALCLLVAMYTALGETALDARYKSDKACLELLQRAPDFHEVLKHAHGVQDYENVRSSDLIRRPTIPPDAQELLDGLRPLLVAFNKTEKHLAPWYPKPKDPLVVDHISSLQLSSVAAVPLMILKDLGTFMDDPVLSSRIADIFVRDKKTVLVNTSGSGKTRLLFEGLYHEWGMYFTTVQDSSRLGSSDILNLIDELSSDAKFSPDLSDNPADSINEVASNRRQIRLRFSEVLLARLLIFSIFLDTANECGGVTEKHKSKWLLLQLVPHLRFYMDIFDRLATTLATSASGDTEKNIADTIVKIRGALGADPHLFFVVDEAQVAARTYPHAFHLEPDKHPFLIELVDIWESYIPADSLSVVIAGTNVPSQIFEEQKDAGRVRWTSNTGSFDERSAHERYLRRFLPPAFLATTSGQEFLERAWRWTRGRYRYTASFVANLLCYNFQAPHTLLDGYITDMTLFNKSIEYVPTDGPELSPETAVDLVLPDDVDALTLIGHDFSPLEQPDAVATRFVLQDAIFHYLATQCSPPLLGRDKIQTVSLGYGFFVDTEMQKITVKEPIILTAAALWMTRSPPRVNDLRGLPVEIPHNFFTILQRDPPNSANTFARCLVFYFHRAFLSTPTLADIFMLPKPIPAWAKQSAELVELHMDGDGSMRYSAISTPDFPGPLATSANDLNTVISWMEHNSRTPFCLPGAMSPDLMFILRLADGSFIWVVIQATTGDSDGDDLLACLEDDSLFCDEEQDPGRTSHNRAIRLLNGRPAGEASKTPTVLRVVTAFEEQIVLKARAAKAGPRASLSMEMFREVTTSITPSEVVASIVASVLGNTKATADPETTHGQAKKRRNSFSVQGPEDDERTTTRGKGKVRTKLGPEPTTRVLRPRREASAEGSNKGKEGATSS